MHRNASIDEKAISTERTFGHVREYPRENVVSSSFSVNEIRYVLRRHACLPKNIEHGQNSMCLSNAHCRLSFKRQGPLIVYNLNHCDIFDMIKDFIVVAIFLCSVRNPASKHLCELFVVFVCVCWCFMAVKVDENHSQVRPCFLTTVQHQSN